MDDGVAVAGRDPFRLGRGGADQLRHARDADRIGEAQHLLDAVDIVDAGGCVDAEQALLSARPSQDPSVAVSPARRRPAAKAKNVGRSPVCVETARS